MFALLQAYAVLNYVQSFLSKSEFKYFFFVAVTLAAGIVFAAVVGLTWLGVIAPWSGRLALKEKKFFFFIPTNG